MNLLDHLGKLITFFVLCGGKLLILNLRFFFKYFFFFAVIRRTTPKRQAAALASTKLKLPPLLDASSDLSDVEMSPVIASKGKGKEVIVLSSDSENEDFEDDSELENLSDRDGARKARTLAKALKSVAPPNAKGKGKGVDSKEVGKSLTRMLKGKGKASSSSAPPSATRKYDFEVVVTQKRPKIAGSSVASSSTSKKSKSTKAAAKEVLILSSGSESAYESDKASSDADSDSEVEDVKPEVEGGDSVEEEDDMFRVVTDEEVVKKKLEKLEALQKMGKKESDKPTPRAGAKISLETKKEMKKMTKVCNSTYRRRLLY